MFARPVFITSKPAAIPHGERLISAAQAALELGVDVLTLQIWNIFNAGPVAVRGLDGATLAYRRDDLAAWQDSHFAELVAS